MLTISAKTAIDAEKQVTRYNIKSCGFARLNHCEMPMLIKMANMQNIAIFNGLFKRFMGNDFW
jgi:hypothetical protein